MALTQMSNFEIFKPCFSLRLRSAPIPSINLRTDDDPMNAVILAPVRQNKSKQIWDTFILLMTVAAGH